MSSVAVADSDALILELSSAFVAYRCLVAAFTVYIFDRFLTFNSEVEHIWRRKKSAITWVYVSMHVCTLLLFVTNVAGWLDQGTCVRSVYFSLLDMGTRVKLVCSAYGLTVTDTAALCALYLIWGVISAARAYTINGCRWPIPAFTFLISLVPVATNIAFCWGLTWEVESPPVNCAVWNRMSQLTEMRLEIASRTCVIAVDLIVLLVTWRATYGMHKSAHSLKIESSIASALLRDGTVYFGVLLVVNVVCMALWVTNTLQAATTFSTVLNTTLLSRFFLNLRGAALAPDTRTLQSTSDPSETHFTSVVFGNLGGSLALGVEDELEGALEQAAVGYDGEVCEVEDNTEA